ncbi:MAG: hypothetical protein EA405_09455 [Rhodospirillales bacterium]|nr:MAG: hypothetical protein EA405_09455 [Rhodospirillales bacterium]
MTHYIQISTMRYEWAHRRKPRGYRLWYFRMPDGTTFCHAGTYAQARQAAMALAEVRYRHAEAPIQLCA